MIWINYAFCIVGDPSPNGVQGHQSQFPPNYRTCCFSFVELVSKAVQYISGIHTPSIIFCSIIQLLNKHVCVRHIYLITLVVYTCLGYSEIKKKLSEMRVRHTWSIMILDEMLHYTTMYQHKPGSDLLEKDLMNLFENFLYPKNPNYKISGKPSDRCDDWINEVEDEVRSCIPIGNNLILAYSISTLIF